MLVIAWIPADFGLALYTGQIAQNASREVARIGAADPTLAQGTVTCIMPCSGATGLRLAAADRMRSALLPGATITIIRDPVVSPACNAQVRVTISGNYNYFFYRLLGWFGVSVPAQTLIQRQTNMRWEHQC